MTSVAPATTGRLAGRIEIEPIAPANLDAVAALLSERNNTLPAYTRWKYGRAGADGSWGVVARLGGEAVGCFGLIPRGLELPGGAMIASRWFADWYVTPRARGRRVGEALLRALAADGVPVFGHPGPAQAQALCRANGYRELGFQSRRRLVLRRRAYERLRTRYALKAGARVLLGLYRSARARGTAPAAVAPHPAPARLADVEAHGRWVVSQPVARDNERTAGVWEGEEVRAVYADDRLASGERRRLVLHTAGHGRARADHWRPFVAHTRAAGAAYVELFTTEREVDAAWQALGAWHHAEAPVLVVGLPASVTAVALHGWDRENWTYLATATRPARAAAVAQRQANVALPVAAR